MNEQNYRLVERLAALRRADRLARRVRPYRLANAAVAVLVFLVVVGEMVAAAGL
jgi:hypothetical protein